VVAKIADSRTVLLRAVRDRPDSPDAAAIEDAATRLALIMDQLREPVPLDRVRGYEGDAARTYFGAFDHLITSQKDAFFFTQRSRRPPLDNINAARSRRRLPSP
jgi:CRISPR-associated protein Cas1